MKILHSADWHLDSPLQGRTLEQTGSLRRSLLELPGKIAQICRQENCQMMLLSGDLFDTSYTAESYQAVYEALESVAVPVFIAPGNHDYVGANSPWLAERWPENVHIFTRPYLSSVDVPELGCRVYGAGFDSMDCPGLLEGFRAEDNAICVLHGDPTQVTSPYCPITQNQVQVSNLRYLALGHIHKGGSFRAGATLCAWPGCPMGRGYDEQGEKGVLIAEITDTVTARFVPLDTPRFYDWECGADEIDSLLPPVGNENFYRITLTGESEGVNLAELKQIYSRFPNLELRDRTVRPVELWSGVGEDSFAGTYFGMLQQELENADEETKRQILLAAKISRQILDGQEVVLP